MYMMMNQMAFCFKGEEWEREYFGMGLRLAQRRARPNPLGWSRKTRSIRPHQTKHLTCAPHQRTHVHPNLSTILDQRNGLAQDDEH
jgi:hypothetical protein